MIVPRKGIILKLDLKVMEVVSYVEKIDFVMRCHQKI